MYCVTDENNGVEDLIIGMVLYLKMKKSPCNSTGNYCARKHGKIA